MNLDESPHGLTDAELSMVTGGQGPVREAIKLMPVLGMLPPQSREEMAETYRRNMAAVDEETKRLLGLRAVDAMRAAHAVLETVWKDETIPFPLRLRASEAQGRLAFHIEGDK